MHVIVLLKDTRLTKPARADMPNAYAQTVEARYAEFPPRPSVLPVTCWRISNSQDLRLLIGLRSKRESTRSSTCTQLAQSPTFARIAERICNADSVYPRHPVDARHQQRVLQLPRIHPSTRVFYSNGMSGSYVDSLNSEFVSPYLIVTDTRAYSMIARRYCEAAPRRGIPFAPVTDIYCPWAREFICDLLQVKTDAGQFWDSLAQLTCLFNLQITAIVAQPVSAIDKRVAFNRKLPGELNQFDL
jgi:hypothetical protein